MLPVLECYKFSVLTSLYACNGYQKLLWPLLLIPTSKPLFGGLIKFLLIDLFFSTAFYDWKVCFKRVDNYKLKGFFSSKYGIRLHFLSWAEEINEIKRLFCQLVNKFYFALYFHFLVDNRFKMRLTRYVKRLQLIPGKQIVSSFS